jgi:hypothetical protein
MKKNFNFLMKKRTAIQFLDLFQLFNLPIINSPSVVVWCSGIGLRIFQVILVKRSCVKIECLCTSITTYNMYVIILRYCLYHERRFISDIRHSTTNRLQFLMPAVWGAISKCCFGNKSFEFGRRERFVAPRPAWRRSRIRARVRRSINTIWIWRHPHYLGEMVWYK